MDKLLDPLFDLQPLTVYLLIAAFCWTEAAFFLGFITPGELAVVTGGILASRGQVHFGVLLGIVFFATVAGNATGFYLGRRFGDGLLQSAFLQRFLSGPIQKAQDFMLRRGEWAIVVGRISTPTRIITPFLAGSSGMTYRRFFVFDLIASLLWAFSFLTLGYLLGESWGLIQEISGTAAMLVLLLFFMALILRWIAVRVVAHQRRVKAAFRLAFRVTGTRGIARALTPAFVWMVHRLDPRLAQGLSLTICFLALIAAIGSAGLVFSQTEEIWGLARIDYPVLEWMVATRTEEAVAIARATLLALHWPGMAVLMIPVMALVLRYADWVAALRIGVGVIGATGGAFLLDRFVLSGHVENAEFPSVPVAAVAALLVHATALTARLKDWAGAVACAAFATFIVFTVALGTLVAGWAAPSGIALGLALGMAWAAALELPWTAFENDSDSPDDSDNDDDRAISNAEPARESRPDPNAA